jgi:hypothetical protein
MVFALNRSGHLRLGVDGVGIKLTAMVEQGTRRLQVVAAFYLTDKNNVVTFFIATAVKALKSGYGTFNQRNSVVTSAPGHARKAINVFGGKLIGEMYLIRTEDVNGVVRTCAKY